MPIVLSNTLKAVQSRIKRLPKLVEDVAVSMRRRDADDLISYWRSGIRDGSLKLDPLRPKTVLRKVRLGYKAPNSPLYGLGFEGQNTYIKGMQKFKTKDGYNVRMVDRKHHKSKIGLKGLFLVHEYGATILGRHATIIIPARPAMAMSYRKVLKDIKKRDPNRTMVRVVKEYLLTGGSETAQRALQLAEASERRNA